MLLFSCSVRYKFTSSHFRRGLFSSSTVGCRVPFVEEWRREVDARALEEARRCPAFCSVFWRVMSLSEMVRSRSGLVSEPVGECAVVAALGGEVWSSGVFRKEFLRMPEVDVRDY